MIHLLIPLLNEEGVEIINLLPQNYFLKGKQ